MRPLGQPFRCENNEPLPLKGTTMAGAWSGHLKAMGDDLPSCHNDFETARLCVFATPVSPQSRAMPCLPLRNLGSKSSCRVAP
jgi:hypothetical protein